MVHEFKEQFLSIVSDQSVNPPGNDRVLGLFYQALGRAISHPTDFGQMILDVQDNRPNITPDHLANLSYRATQFSLFRENNLDHQNFSSTEQWHDVFEEIEQNPMRLATVNNLLLNRSTSSTIYQRCIGPYAVISRVHNGNPITVADLGCGGNYFLTGIDIKEPFQPIIDYTPNATVSRYADHKINLARGLAFDQEDPCDPEVKEWRMACGFYPSELNRVPELQEFEKRISASRNVRFMKANLLVDCDRLPKHVADIAVMSTVLYQHNDEERAKLIKAAKSTLKTPDSFLIVQDFALRDDAAKSGLNFDTSWGSPFSYRTFLTRRDDQEFLEVLQWNNGRCTAVRPGQDYAKIFDEDYLSMSSAA